jgi:alcohol dehydrogenase class IV
MDNVFLGNNTTEKLKTLIETNNITRIYLVTNKNSFISSGVSDHIFQHLVNCEYRRYKDFSVNPKFEEIEFGVKEVNEFKPKLIVGVGGGSAMDMAKLIFHSIDDSNIELMCIPTTSGSGSEATQFAVYYKDGIKQSLDDIKILPKHVIVDGYLTQNLPRHITAYTGIDAISQAMESFWSVAATSESKKIALKSLEITVPTILNAVNNPSLDDREKMAIGSFYAGQAINITRTTAPHAFSYYLTSKYNFAHGHAVGLVIPFFILENSKHCDLNPLFKIFEVTSVNELKDKFQIIMESVGLENDLYSIIKDDLDGFLEAVDMKRLKNNPAQLNKEEFRSLFSNK